MYWCHVCCLRFQWDNLVIDGRQMVSLVSVHGRDSLFDIYSLLHVSLVPVGFTGQYFSVLRVFSVLHVQIIPPKSEATRDTST